MNSDSIANHEPSAWQRDYRELDRQLLAAHASDNREALVHLYAQAADAAANRDDPEAARFYLTHAYVFALDTGNDEHVRLKQCLDQYDD